MSSEFVPLITIHTRKTLVPRLKHLLPSWMPIIMPGKLEIVLNCSFLCKQAVNIRAVNALSLQYEPLKQIFVTTYICQSHRSFYLSTPASATQERFPYRAVTCYFRGCLNQGQGFGGWRVVRKEERTLMWRWLSLIDVIVTWRRLIALL